jgi:hypothetical protein
VQFVSGTLAATLRADTKNVFVVVGERREREVAGLAGRLAVEGEMGLGPTLRKRMLRERAAARKGSYASARPRGEE